MKGKVSFHFHFNSGCFDFNKYSLLLFLFDNLKKFTPNAFEIKKLEDTFCDFLIFLSLIILAFGTSLNDASSKDRKNKNV